MSLEVEHYVPCLRHRPSSEEAIGPASAATIEASATAANAAPHPAPCSLKGTMSAHKRCKEPRCGGGGDAPACPGEATAASDTSIDLNNDEIKAEAAEVELTLKDKSQNH